MPGMIAARGESLAAFDRRCIPAPPQRGCRVGDPGAGCVAPSSNTPGIATPPRKPRAAGAPVLGRRALPAGRLTRLGATPDFHHGLLVVAQPQPTFRSGTRLMVQTVTVKDKEGRSIEGLTSKDF